MNVEALFELAYPVGTDVVVVDDEDGVIRGKVKVIGDDGLTVQCVGRKADVISWPNLRFIAHDGFPVREFRGPHKENSEAEIAELRKKLSVAERLAASRSAVRTDGWSRPRSYGHFGDPFEVVGVMTPAHLGNGGPGFADSFESEVLLFDAPDGALAMLWDLETVYELGQA